MVLSKAAVADCGLQLLLKKAAVADWPAVSSYHPLHAPKIIHHTPPLTVHHSI